jgi:beta-lactamase regulating signal transducer with metallopeptidase domain
MEFVLRASAILAFAWLVTALMRRASAASRHLVWTCALAAAAILPPLATIAPHWEITWPVAVQAPAPSVPVATPIARNSQPAPQPPSITATSTRRLSAAEWTLLAWAAGTFVMLGYIVTGLVSATRVARRTIAQTSTNDDVNALAEALGIRQRVTIVESDATATPIACGLFRPRIVMPHDAATWSEERRHVALLHELAHIKRHDCLTQLLAHLVCAAYWFNPLAWIAARRLRAERERACDDVVLAAGTRNSDYANHLLAIAQALQPARLSPLAATTVSMARRSQLEGRLMAILDPHARRTSAFYTKVAAASLVALISIPVAAVQLVSPAPSAAPQPAVQVTLTPQIQTPAQPTGAVRISITPQIETNQTQTPAPATTPSSQDAVLRRAFGRMLVAFAGDGELENAQAALAAGADINTIVPGDGTPLIAAAGDGHLEVVSFLLDKGADPNLSVRGEGTALIAAAGEGYAAIVDLLLQRGAQVNQIAEGDETALIQAADEGHLDVVTLLVSKGADVNLGAYVEEVDWDTDFNGIRDRRTVLRTPLNEAADEGHLDIVRLLISAGARD